MRTPLRFAGFTLAAVVAVAVLAGLVLPGLATARGAGEAPVMPQPARVAPASAPIEPALVDVAMPTAAVDLPVPDPVPVQPTTVTPTPQPSVPTEPAAGPNGSVSSPVMPFDPGYWTPERMANAKPMPMPTVP